MQPDKRRCTLARRSKGTNLMRKFTRRHFLAPAASTALAAPYVRGAHAAGKLTVGFWDHWVPTGNEALKTLCEEWGAKEKVDVQIDFIPSQGFKLLMTIQAEAQAKVGHDIMALSTWLPSDHANNLERVDDVRSEERRVGKECRSRW